jgi:hypothetical protein
MKSFYVFSKHVIWYSVEFIDFRVHLLQTQIYFRKDNNFTHTTLHSQGTLFVVFRSTQYHKNI